MKKDLKFRLVPFQIEGGLPRYTLEKKNENNEWSSFKTNLSKEDALKLVTFLRSEPEEI